MGLAQVSALLFVVVVFSETRPGCVDSLAQAEGHVVADVSFPSALESVPERIVQTPVVSRSTQLKDVRNFLSQQTLLGPVKKLAWHFPKAPKLTKQLAKDDEMPISGPVSSVAVECGENTVYVEVKEDMFGTGQLIDPLALTLGGCAAAGEDPTAGVLIFESPLQACNSTLSVVDKELVYDFVLVYALKIHFSASAPVLRTSNILIGLRCHYPRLHNVSSKALLPAWIPYASTQVAEDVLIFSLRLMTVDWKFERLSNQYFLGDVIKFEASVMQFNHVPLRVHVDSCVATAVPDVNAVHRYSFIDHYGCFVDAKLTGSKSRFKPQKQADKLQFQLEAFKFQEDHMNLIYIACVLKATVASSPVDSQHKACSFSSNGWSATYGEDEVCGCCDTSCTFKKGQHASEQDLLLEEVTLGPIQVKGDA